MRNGSGANELCYGATTLPVLGSTLVLSVDASLTPAATTSVVVAYTQPLTLPTGFGELLVDVTSSFVFSSGAPVVGTTSTHSVPVPASASFAGFTVSSQAALIGGGVKLCNAVDLVAGF